MYVDSLFTKSLYHYYLACMSDKRKSVNSVCVDCRMPRPRAELRCVGGAIRAQTETQINADVIT